MKVRKNIEGLFLVAAFVATSASFATAQIPQAAGQAPIVVAAADTSIPTVVVSAKRLTAAEKAAMN
ncbi:MAG TPA: hypothetical protein VFT37_03975 [Telluria sp.]|nr:hypothetical protein [Telluria sp.]